MVIGPTPPGTGVIAEATSTASSNATSPTSRVLPSPFSGAGTRLMPTSMTTAPGFTQSPRTMPGRPTAATSTSALWQTAGRSAVREWAIVTVASRWSSNCAIGLPTMFERPSTTACLPASEGPITLSISSAEPMGVHGTSALAVAPPASSPTTLTGWNPSTSLAGSIAISTRSASMPCGSGNCTRMPSIPGSAFSAATRASTSTSPVVAGSVIWSERKPAASASRLFERHRPGSPGPRRRGRRRDRAGAPWPRGRRRRPRRPGRGSCGRRPCRR